MTSEAPVQQRYLDLVDRIETRCDVICWRSGDIDLWPPARMDLFLDMFRASGGDTAPATHGFIRRAAGNLATPLTNAWKSRLDLKHCVPWPRPADAIMLGDGVSLDRIDGAWRDRHGERVMAALERRGGTTFLMQPGGLDRLPWARPTFAANTIAVRAAMAASLDRHRPVDLPDHAAVREILEQAGVQAPSLAERRLVRRAASIAAAAARFQQVLRRVRPRVAFVVTYYAGLGHAFALACRREGLLCVDLQHCPQDSVHRAYRWREIPERGFSTLPGAFWTWTAAEAEAWTGRSPWHTAVHGGHSQLAPYLGDRDPATRRWDERFSAVGDADAFGREILVALQPLGGRREVWDALARQMEQAPANWRWWIRRHPSASASQDAECQAVLGLRRPNIVIGAASELPLPALLRHMSALVSLASGSAAEAAAFGVPALFLDREALGTFPGLLARGQAQLVGVDELVPRIAAAPRRPPRRAAQTAPPTQHTLRRLDELAEAYGRLCRSAPLETRRSG